MDAGNVLQIVTPLNLYIMGFRYYKRMKLGKGFGLNISKSSIRPSYRSRRGSISTKGFSIRTGISGLQFRKNFSKGGCVVILSVAFFLTLAVACTESDTSCENRTCAEFQTQSEAQLEFDSNPACYRNLDSDNDGIPCENLPD
jgi:hypothetical protein